MFKNIKLTLVFTFLLLVSTVSFSKQGEENNLQIDWTVSKDIKYPGIQDRISELMNDLDEEVIDSYINYKKEYKEDSDFLTSGIYLSLLGSGDKVENSWGIYSYIYDYYEYTGGAHGLSGKLIFNYKDDKPLNLDSVFKTGFKDFLVSSINDEISKNSKLDNEDSNKKFYYNSVKNLRNQQIYFEKDSLVVYFPQYEIAPYASGQIFFYFTKEQLKDYIK